MIEEEVRGFCYMKPFKVEKTVSVTKKLII